jgi:addiction module HigA family antidote
LVPKHQYKNITANTKTPRNIRKPGEVHIENAWRMKYTGFSYKAHFPPDTAILPGEYLVEEIVERGITQKELARRMGRPLNAINEIINGKKAITARTALQLEEVIPEIPAKFWLNLEMDYQLTKALISKRAGVV